MARIIHEDGYRYPLIPKKYYAAVMFACKMIRQNGYKNKAIRIAANYYGIDEDELREHVDARTAAGTRAAVKDKKKALRMWYVLDVTFTSEDVWEQHRFFTVASANNKRNAETNVAKKEDNRLAFGRRQCGFYNDYGDYFGAKAIAQFSNKKDAENAADQITELYNATEKHSSYDEHRGAQERYSMHLEKLKQTLEEDDKP